VAGLLSGRVLLALALVLLQTLNLQLQNISSPWPG
jgi:two-component system sensor histidine kinase PilS (NtrC family)